MRKTLLDEKPLIHVWRPLYRHFVSPIAWPFLQRVRSLVGSNQKAPKRSSADGQLGKEEHAILGRLNQIEAQNTRQWEAIERLILCILGEPSSSLSRKAKSVSALTGNRVVSNTPDLRVSSGVQAGGPAPASRKKAGVPAPASPSRKKAGGPAPASRKKAGVPAPASRKKRR